MTESAGGSGTAHNASVSIADLEGQLAEARDRAEREQPARRVAGLEAKVEKLEAHLAGAREALKAAKAAAKGN